MNEAAKLRRFWETVRITHNDHGYQILLDERPVKLPKKSSLYVSSLPLAEKIAEEWKNAGEKKGDLFSFYDLPMTQIAGTMIEKVAPAHDTYIEVLLPYVNGDLLCYYADTPQKLVLQQQEKWLPLIKWIEEKFQIKLKIQHGIMPIYQHAEIIEQFKNYLLHLNDAELTYFAIIVPLLGSMILSIALKEEKITVQQAFALAHLDEIIQAEIWGKDTEQQERLNKVEAEINDAFNFYQLSKK